MAEGFGVDLLACGEDVQLRRGDDLEGCGDGARVEGWEGKRVFRGFEGGQLHGFEDQSCGWGYGGDTEGELVDLVADFRREVEEAVEALGS